MPLNKTRSSGAPNEFKSSANYATQKTLLITQKIELVLLHHAYCTEIKLIQFARKTTFKFLKDI